MKLELALAKAFPQPIGVLDPLHVVSMSMSYVVIYLMLDHPNICYATANPAISCEFHLKATFYDIVKIIRT